jgi:cardiolipin synthase
MIAVFEKDLESAKRYTYEMWKERPLKEKLFEKLILPIKSQL